MEVSPERREAELADAYNRANLTFNAFMAQFNEVCTKLAGDMTIVNLEATEDTTSKPAGSYEVPLGGGTDFNNDGIPDTVTYYTTAVDGTSRAVLDLTIPNMIEDARKEIQEHKEWIEKGDTRYGLLNALSRKTRIEELERRIIENGGKL